MSGQLDVSTIVVVGERPSGKQPLLYNAGANDEYACKTDSRPDRRYDRPGWRRRLPTARLLSRQRTDPTGIVAMMRTVPLFALLLIAACTTADDAVGSDISAADQRTLLPPGHVPAPPPKPWGPNWLYGLTFEEVVRYLGQPDNQDGPSQSESGLTFGRSIDYFNEVCNFSVWFRRKKDTPWGVHFFYAYDRNGKAVEIAPCLETFLQIPTPE